MSYLPGAFVHRYPPQRVIFGPGASKSLGEVLASLGAKRALLLCGANLGAAAGLTDAIVAGAGGRLGSVWTGVRPHTPFETVDAAVAEYCRIDADGLVSLGGGSAHDTMRAVALLAVSGGTIADRFRDAEKSFVRIDDAASLPRVPMVALPTTLSAAETTYGGGTTNNGRKYVFMGDALFIDRVVLDPELFATTPGSILVDTGFNAINHAVERLCSPNHQPIADAAFLHALRLLLPALQRISDDRVPGEQAITDACLGAHLSESTNVLGGIGHAIAHVLGGRYALPHGTAHGLGLIPGLRLAGPRSPAGVDAIHRVLRETGYLRKANDDLEAVIASFRAYLSGLGRASRLRDVGIAETEVPLIAADVMADVSAAHAARSDLNAALATELIREIW